MVCRRFCSPFVAHKGGLFFELIYSPVRRFRRHMNVSLSGRKLGVTHDLLDDRQLHAFLYSFCCCGVAAGVRRQIPDSKFLGGSMVFLIEFVFIAAIQ